MFPKTSHKDISLSLSPRFCLSDSVPRVIYELFSLPSLPTPCLVFRFSLIEKSRSKVNEQSGEKVRRMRADEGKEVFCAPCFSYIALVLLSCRPSPLLLLLWLFHLFCFTSWPTTDNSTIYGGIQSCNGIIRYRQWQQHAA